MTLPELHLTDWRTSKDTLHLYAQIIGKIRLATTPPRNHWWNLGRRCHQAVRPHPRLVDSVFEEFSGWFTGKTSPVHVFWHGLDLAVTRFSGRPAPPLHADP